MRPALPLGLLLVLAACGQPAPSVDTNTAAAEPAGLSNLQQAVVDLPDGQRDGVLFRAIRDGDAACQGVSRVQRQADQDGRPVYLARCTDGPAYLIAIGPDGTAQVTLVSANRG